MTCFVDDMYLYPIGRYGRYKMSHMVADSTEELLAMASNIGLSHRWLQKAGTHHEHFDVSLAYRKLAIEHGAVEVTMRQMGDILRERRKTCKSIPSNRV